MTGYRRDIAYAVSQMTYRELMLYATCIADSLDNASIDENCVARVLLSISDTDLQIDHEEE